MKVRVESHQSPEGVGDNSLGLFSRYYHYV